MSHLAQVQVQVTDAKELLRWLEKLGTDTEACGITTRAAIVRLRRQHRIGFVCLLVEVVTMLGAGACVYLHAPWAAAFFAVDVVAFALRKRAERRSLDILMDSARAHGRSMGLEAATVALLGRPS